MIDIGILKMVGRTDRYKKGIDKGSDVLYYIMSLKFLCKH